VDLPGLHVIERSHSVILRWEHGEISLIKQAYAKAGYLFVGEAHVSKTHRRQPERWGQKMYTVAADVAKALGYKGIMSMAGEDRSPAADRMWGQLSRRTPRYRKGPTGMVNASTSFADFLERAW